MNEQQSRTVDVLNRLYAAECRSLLARLVETGAFVSWASAGDMALMQQMVEEEREHRAWLVEAMDRCCGVLYPAGPDMRTGHLHYLDLHALMPQVAASLEGLIRLYQEAAGQPLAKPAGEVINRILQRHQRHLEQLRGVQDRAATARS